MLAIAAVAIAVDLSTNNNDGDGGSPTTTLLAVETETLTATAVATARAGLIRTAQRAQGLRWRQDSERKVGSDYFHHSNKDHQQYERDTRTGGGRVLGAYRERERQGELIDIDATHNSSGGNNDHHRKQLLHKMPHLLQSQATRMDVREWLVGSGCTMLFQSSMRGGD